MANPDVWSIFHDGEIVSASGNVPGDLDFIIEIEYIREQFDEDGDAFRLHVVGCDSLVFRPFDTDEIKSDVDALMGHDMEILSAEQVGDAIAVIMAGGVMTIRYQEETIALDTGRPLQLSDVAAAANRALSNDWPES